MSHIIESQGSPASKKIVISFDATELDNWEMCKFRWHMFHERHIVGKNQEDYFDKGTLLHYFMELYYEAKKLAPPDQAKIEEIIEKGRVRSLDFDLSLEEVGEIVFQFREYHRFYESENIIPLYVEEPFMVEIYNSEDLQVFISGKPDLIFRYASSPAPCVMDHKRMQRKHDYSPLRNQFLLYATALNTDTVIVNGIGFQKTIPPKDRFSRKAMIYSEEIREEWKQDAIRTAREMIVYQQAQHYPRNRTSCEKFSGCYLQRYCATKPHAREFLIGSEYLVGEQWDVGRKLELSEGKENGNGS